MQRSSFCSIQSLPSPTFPWHLRDQQVERSRQPVRLYSLILPIHVFGPLFTKKGSVSKQSRMVLNPSIVYCCHPVFSLLQHKWHRQRKETYIGDNWLKKTWTQRLQKMETSKFQTYDDTTWEKIYDSCFDCWKLLALRDINLYSNDEYMTVNVLHLKKRTKASIYTSVLLCCHYLDMAVNHQWIVS